MQDDDDLLDDMFNEDDNDAESPEEDVPWRILIVDDEEDIHQVTKLTIGHKEFLGRRIEFLDAYSGAEALELLNKENDIALVLLDVVMENDHAGLDVAEKIRNELENVAVRIVLRTGQPGSAPEEDIIRDYDINDYKEKGELTSRRLYTTIFSALRSYRDIIALEKTKGTLESIITSSEELFQSYAVKDFAENVLKQLTTLLHLGQDALYYKASSKPDANQGYARELIVGIGDFANLSDITQADLPADINAAIEQAKQQHSNLFLNDHYLAYFKTHDEVDHVLYIKGAVDKNITAHDKSLLEVFCYHVAAIFELFVPKAD